MPTAMRSTCATRTSLITSARRLPPSPTCSSSESSRSRTIVAPTRFTLATGFCPRNPPSRTLAMRPASVSSDHPPPRCVRSAQRSLRASSPSLTACRSPRAAAQAIGFPVMVKPSGGGGGIGMKVVESEQDLVSTIESSAQAARSAFGDPTVYMERYIRKPRHIEIQVICDSHGNAVHLGERECSIQRRHQKIMEEPPSPAVSAELRAAVCDAAIRAARAAGYVNAGTVEFIFSDGDFYFLEVNARLQVEHPITEAVTGIDLVKEQIRVAAGMELSFAQGDVTWRGHAIEMRINAEDPVRKFLPNPKRISRWVAPAGPGVRVDSGFGPGSDVPPNYDSLIAKLIVHGSDRAEAIARARRALREFVVVGPATTISYHRAILENTDFRSGNLSTRFIEDHPDLVEQAKTLSGEAWPFDYEPDPRHVAAAAAAVAAVVRQK